MANGNDETTIKALLGEFVRETVVHERIDRQTAAIRQLPPVSSASYMPDSQTVSSTG